MPAASPRPRGGDRRRRAPDRPADREILVAGSSPGAAFREFQALYPGTVFPPVWFIGGHMGPGGMKEQVGAVVAAQRYLQNPEGVVHIALHELTHFQQAMVQGVDTYQRIYPPGGGSLLALALREGTAELFAELTTGQHINAAAEAYGLAHEAQLWAEFSGQLEDADTGDWMFVRPADPERPADLGYWMGYRIVRSYYDRAPDKMAAAMSLLALTDFSPFLRGERLRGALQPLSGTRGAPRRNPCGRRADSGGTSDRTVVAAPALPPVLVEERRGPFVLARWIAVLGRWVEPEPVVVDPQTHSSVVISTSSWLLPGRGERPASVQSAPFSPTPTPPAQKVG